MVYFCDACRESSGGALERQVQVGGGGDTVVTYDAEEGKRLDEGSTPFPVEGVCNICLGIFQEPNFSNQLEDELRKAVKPYSDAVGRPGCCNRLLFSRCLSPPMVILPGDVIFRLQTAAATTMAANAASKEKESSSPFPSKVNTEEYARDIKLHAKNSLLRCLEKMEKASQDLEKTTAFSYPDCVAKEELGYLGVHVIVLPKSHVQRPGYYNEKIHGYRGNNKRGRSKAKPDGPQQGGDPRQNHEERIIKKYSHKSIWTINQAIIDARSTDAACFFFDLDDRKPPTERSMIDIHVAIWRRPFYLGSCYSKTRRDVSQTPFFVTENGKRKRLGVTSVEEQILCVIEKHCNGISVLNNNDFWSDKGSQGGTVFGMAKFHASGREDMDVRMIVPSLMKEANDFQSQPNIKDRGMQKKVTGRPFVCEIIDAYSMPSPTDLKLIVEGINQNKGEAYETGEDGQSKSRTECYIMSYGNNPMGVGIAPTLEFVSSLAFKNLQAQTESKVKHYGCRCWSQHKLPTTDDELNEKLGGFPLEIHQRTPLRVVHRRSNIVRIRNILFCNATIIDDHHFMLHLGTDAGTYVKEFVHGDLGRTVPSVGLLLGCKADILELDCEGIQI